MLKKEDFSEWYSEVIDKAGLCDKRYPIKGMNVWTPYGWKIMSRIDGFMREAMEKTGHSEVLFPLLIPEEEFKKETKHIKGFEEEVYWVTHAGDNPLDVKLVLRPTSETAMYPVFALWIRSHADLPLKTYQIVNVFRYETKQTRAFIRVREIHFFEAHTCHANFEEAEEQVREDIEIMNNLSEKFCLPYLISKRPEWDKFPGAHYSLSVDTLVSATGRTLQIGTIHQYKDNFAKAFNIKFEDLDGKRKYVHQTTYGMSERLVGAMISIHGDDRGIVLPPEVAPYEIVIVPILAKGSKRLVTRESERIYNKLKDYFRVHLDERDLRPGSKFYEWEAKGVPLRLEIGTRDIKKREVTIARRDTMERSTLPQAKMIQGLKRILQKIQKEMYERAEKELKENILTIQSLDEVKGGIMRMGWCGEEECGHKVEERTGMNILGVPFSDEKFDGKCIVCGKETSTVIYAAKAY